MLINFLLQVEQNHFDEDNNFNVQITEQLIENLNFLTDMTSNCMGK